MKNLSIALLLCLLVMLVASISTSAEPRKAGHKLNQRGSRTAGAKKATLPAGDPCRECDLLAADPFSENPTKAAGVPVSKIDHPKALRACEAALLIQPDSAHYHYLRGRSLIAAGRYADAIDCLIKGAEGKESGAFVQLCLLHLDGDGVAEDPERAKSFAQTAAQMGHPAGAFYFANFLEDENRGPEPAKMPGWIQAADLYQRALKNGFWPAAYRLAVMELNPSAGLTANVPDAVNYMKIGAQNNEPSCVTGLGDMVGLGIGMDQDPQRAATLYISAADSGHLEGMHKAGLVYLRGIGRPQDEAQGVQYVRRAADAGYEPAVIDLARLYAGGQGVAADPVYAEKLLAAPVANGSLAAKEILWNVQLMQVETKPENFKTAVELITECAKADMPESQNALGYLYLEGIGLEKPEVELGRYWLGKAADQGHAGAAEKLKSIPASIATATDAVSPVSGTTDAAGSPGETTSIDWGQIGYYALAAGAALLAGKVIYDDIAAPDDSSGYDPENDPEVQGSKAWWRHESDKRLNEELNRNAGVH